MALFDMFKVPVADATHDRYIKDVVGRKTDAAVATVTTTKSLMGYVKGLLSQANKLDGAALGTVVAGSAIASIPHCVEKSDGAVLAGVDPIFTITGGPVICNIFGLVTTAIVSTVNLRLQHITTAPAATVELNAGAVAANDDAIGTFYYNVGATSVFTPSGGLGFALLDPVTVESVHFLLAPGVVQCLGSAARTGVIKWYMYYMPLSPNSLVTAAA